MKALKGFKLSPLYSEDGKVKIRRLHYRGCMIIAYICVVYVHRHAPDYDIHYAVLIGILSAADPT